VRIRGSIGDPPINSPALQIFNLAHRGRASLLLVAIANAGT